MFKRIRIAVLLYVLAFVAVSSYLTSRHTTDWNAPLWVDVYPVLGDATAVSQDYIEQIGDDEFADIEHFFQLEAGRFGIGLNQPFRLNLADQLDRAVPELPATASILGTVLWSLRMRWLTFVLNWRSDNPTPDIVLFVIYHDPNGTPIIERSGALKKGLIAVANVFAERASRGANQVVIAHELLHTLGATDKYDPATNMPHYPEGFAHPDAKPIYPQSKAELMAGRIVIAADQAEIPASLGSALIGPETAGEIGWTEN